MPSACRKVSRVVLGEFSWNQSFVGFPMTIDKSLKVKAGMTRARNVLTRAERLSKLSEYDRWSEGDPVLGLPKVRVQKISLKKKKKVKKAEDEEGDKKGKKK